jgi:hypothetical protein
MAEQRRLSIFNLKANIPSHRILMSFKSVTNKIAKKEGLSKDRAAAILAASSRAASPAAKRKNPKLKKVKG